MRKFFISFLMLLTFTVTSFSQGAGETVQVINGTVETIKAVNQTVQTVVAIDGNDTVKTVITDSARLTAAKVYEDAKEGLIGLAMALKAPVEHVYSILIKQQIVYAVTYTLLDLFLITLTFLLFYNFLKNNLRTNTTGDNWYRDDMEDHFGLIGLLILSIIMAIVTLVAITCNLSDIATGFINPEYGAIKEVFNFIQ